MNGWGIASPLSYNLGRLPTRGAVRHPRRHRDFLTDDLAAAESKAREAGAVLVREYIFRNARLPLGEVKDRGHYGSRSWPEEFDGRGDDFMVPLVTDPDRIILVVAGGDGCHSSWFPAWSATQRAT